MVWAVTHVMQLSQSQNKMTMVFIKIAAYSWNSRSFEEGGSGVANWRLDNSISQDIQLKAQEAWSWNTKDKGCTKICNVLAA